MNGEAPGMKRAANKGAGSRLVRAWAARGEQFSSSLSNDSTGTECIARTFQRIRMGKLPDSLASNVSFYWRLFLRDSDMSLKCLGGGFKEWTAGSTGQPFRTSIMSHPLERGRSRSRG